MPQTNDRSEHSNIGEIRRILNSLANEDALKIFDYIKNNIMNSTKKSKIGLDEETMLHWAQGTHEGSLIVKEEGDLSL